jgi:hypothetical protein
MRLRITSRIRPAGQIVRPVLQLLIMVVAGVGAAAGQAIDELPDLARWEGRLIHEVFRTEDGLPVNSVTSLLQTRDGYLWIGTFDGLVRFDGARFTVFNTANNESLPGNRITQLFESSDGTVWFATESKLVRFTEQPL